MITACIRSGLVALMLTTSFAAMAQERPTVAIAREHIGDDCVSGVMKVEDDFVAFAVAVPHRGKKPLLAALIPGTFDAQLRGSAGEGWHITFTPIAGQPAVQLQLGRASNADAGGIAIGDELAGECHFSKRSEYKHAAHAFGQRLRPFQPGGSGPLAIRLRIEDR